MPASSARLDYNGSHGETLPIAVTEGTWPELVRTHRKLLELTDELAALRSKLYRRASQTTLNPFAALREVLRLRTMGPYTFALSRAESARAKATPAERKDARFESAVDAFWPEEAARYAIAALQLDKPTAKALLDVHDAYEERTKQVAGLFSPKLLIGVVLAAGAFFANQVPKELFTFAASKGWFGAGYYTQYRAYAFLALLIALGYVLLVLVALGPLAGRAGPRRVLANLGLTRLLLVNINAGFDASSMGDPDGSREVAQ